MNRKALYYPFHLCREETLQALLQRYDSVHFRDYMAMRLTPMFGTTAYHDRMGQQHPDLVAAGRIVQGYDVSGPLDEEMSRWVDHDLSDPTWRALFHSSLMDDRRFQRGLFDLSHSMMIAGRRLPGPAALLRLLESARSSTPYSITGVKGLADRPQTMEEAYAFEYGVALIKTAAALRYTVRLAQRVGLVAVTDSLAHFRLLDRTCDRERVTLDNECIKPDRVAEN